MKLSTYIGNFPACAALHFKADDCGPASSREGNGLGNWSWLVSGGGNLFRVKTTPPAKTLNEAVPATFSRLHVPGLLSTCFAFGLAPYRSTSRTLKNKKQKTVGRVRLPQAEPPSCTFHALPGCEHTSLISSGVFWGCRWDGALKRLGPATAPALFPLFFTPDPI